MKYSYLVCFVCIVLLFLSGCVEEQEKTNIISLCTDKTNITYSDSPDCLTAGKCNEKYNSLFGFSFKSETLKTLNSAKSNYEKSIIDSWVSMSNLLSTTKKINTNCSKPASDEFLSSLQYLYSYSKISSSDLTNLGYRQTVLLGSIKKELEDNDINLLANTGVYKSYISLTDNWNITMDKLVISSPGFKLQQTGYSSWTYFNNSYLYSQAKVSNQSVVDYRQIIRFGLLQEKINNYFFGLIELPENTLLTAFAEALFDNIINAENINYYNLTNIFNEYFNLADFVKEYTSIFGYNGTVIKLLTDDAKKLDSEIYFLEQQLEQKKDTLIAEVNLLTTDITQNNSSDFDYLSSKFNLGLGEIDYSEKVESITLELTNLADTLGKKYYQLNKTELEITEIQTQLNNHKQNTEKIIFTCDSEINNIFSENKNNQTAEYYYKKYVNNRTLENCALFFQNTNKIELDSCKEKIKKIISELEISLNYNPEKACEELKKLEEDYLIYLDSQIYGLMLAGLKSKYSNLNIIRASSPLCISKQINELYAFIADTKNSNKLMDYISKNGLNKTGEEINKWDKTSSEMLSTALPCYLNNIYIFSNSAISFPVQFSWDSKIEFELPVAELIEDLSGKRLITYDCKQKFCNISLTGLDPLTELNIVYKSNKYTKQESELTDHLELYQSFCFNAKTANPILEKSFSADKIDIFDDSGKILTYEIIENKIYVTDAIFKKDSCITVKNYFFNAISKELTLESTDEMDDQTTRYIYSLKIKNNLATLITNAAINTGINYDTGEVFDLQGKEYTPKKAGGFLLFYANLKPLSENTFSIIVYAKDEEKKFISEITELKEICEELLNSPDETIREKAREILEKIKNLELLSPNNNPGLQKELVDLISNTEKLKTENEKSIIKTSEKSLVILRYKNLTSFLETIKKNQGILNLITGTQEFSIPELNNDLHTIEEEITKLETSDYAGDQKSIDKMRAKYAEGLEKQLESISAESSKMETYSKLLFSPFKNFTEELDAAKTALYFMDYNAFFSALESVTNINNENETALEKNIKIKKEDIDSKFAYVETIKTELDSAWTNYNRLLSLFNSNDFELAKNYEKIPYGITAIKDNKKVLDTVTKDIISIDSLKNNFDIDYLKDSAKAVINFDSKKIDTVIYNYYLASNNLEQIELGLQAIATENILLAEKNNGDKNYLYDAKSDLENKDYFNAIINAKKALSGTTITSSSTAIYGLGILVFCGIIFALYFLLSKTKRKKKVTYYTVPK